jgi:hypothetical protein
MKQLDTVNKTAWGWALELNDEEAQKVLEHFLWECQNELELSQKIAQAFNGPMTLPLRWEKDKRSVSISCDNGRAFTAEIKPSDP